jgi:hypothetical protein
VIQQDVEIMANQGKGLRFYGENAFAHTPADTLHVHIEALRGWAERGGGDAKPGPVVDEMEFWI